MVNFSAAIIASCVNKTITSWYELRVGVVDYILLWDASFLKIDGEEVVAVRMLEVDEVDGVLFVVLPSIERWYL